MYRYRPVSFVPYELELVLPEVDEELDRLGLALDADLELHLEGEVGGDALPFPDAHVLLDDALHALDV